MQLWFVWFCWCVSGPGLVCVVCVVVGTGLEDGDSVERREVRSGENRANIPNVQMIMGGIGKCAFTENGQYFAYYGDDGKLKVWEAETAVLKQEYTPDFHLGSPGTCVVWMKLSLEAASNAILRKKKKKIKSSEERNEVDACAIGTSSGNILIYSVASGSVIATLEGGPASPVNCLSWNRGSNLFSCAGENILEWNVGLTTIQSNWKAGKDVVTNLLVLPDGKHLLSASHSITLWKLPEHEPLKTYAGHASNVTALLYVPAVSPTSECYFVSAGKTDRYLSAWNLNVNSRNSMVAQFLMEDIVTHLSLFAGNETDATTMAAVTRSGSLHLYKLQLNGKSVKPFKPKLTVQIASKGSQSQSKESVVPIPIVGALLHCPSIVLLAYGCIPFLSFEKITSSSTEKALCLVREDPRKTIQQKKGLPSKVMQPEVGVDSQYINSFLGTSSGLSKRGHKIHCEVPMEERLNNLTLNRTETSSGAVPLADNVAHLLLQGLRSKDKRIVHTVLLQRDETVIRRTVARLPVEVVVPLVQELSVLMQGKVVRCQVAAQWLRAAIGIHASQILANPGATECFTPILGLVESRLEMLTPLSRLRGRLDLLMDQLTAAQNRSSQTECDSLLVYQDSYSSDEDSIADDKSAHSGSDDNWDDLSESEIQDAELDAEMSV